jgi:hypothetical protein
MKNFVRNTSNNFKFNAEAVIGGNCFIGNWAMEIKEIGKNDDRKGVGKTG